MTFVNDDNEILEFNGSFAITKQAVSIFNGKIKGDVSISFSLDNNSVNRKILGYYGPQMINNVAFTKHKFSRIRNGNILDTGYIIIQSENETSLKCFYLSGNSNWLQLIGGLITELYFDDKYSVHLSAEGFGTFKNYDITSRLNSTQGIVFPLVDWNYNLNKGNNAFPTIGETISNRSFIYDVNQDPQKPVHEFYPCLYVKDLINEIVVQSGLKISGSLLKDEVFKTLVITPGNGLMKRKPFNLIYVTGSSQIIPTSIATKYTSFTTVVDNDGKFINNSYTANKNLSIVVTVNFVAASTVSLSNFHVYKNGVSIISTPISAVGGTYKFPLLGLFNNDLIEFYVLQTTGSNQTYQINCKIEANEYIALYDFVYPEYFLPKIKSLDFIKGIFNLFGCVAYFNEYSKTITANIIEIIKIEDSIEWSDYYLSHESNYTELAASNNYLNYIDNDSDSKLKNYNEKNNLSFASGNIETDNTLKFDNTIFNLPFTATTFDISKNTIFNSNIPLVDLVDSGEPIPFTATAFVDPTNPDYGVTDFTVADSSIFGFSYGSTAFEIVKIVNSSGNNLGYFFLINPLSSSPPTTTVSIYFFNTPSISGYIVRQQINYQDVGVRLLSVINNIPISNFSFQSRIALLNSGITTVNSWTYGTFTKPLLGKSIDSWKANLAFDNINVNGYNDPTMKERYFNKISRILKNPPIKTIMLLPEAVYQSFDFSNFIYLKTERLTGYFFVESIENYVDGNTPVTVNLFML